MSALCAFDTFNKILQIILKCKKCTDENLGL